MPNNEYWVEVDEQGRLILPPEVAEHYGIQPGAQMRLKESSKNLHLQGPITHLAKVYIEHHCSRTAEHTRIFIWLILSFEDGSLI